MVPVRDIPGFYYDQEKKKYFKIEKTGTAPVNSAWSADNVKRRRLEDDVAAEALQRMVLNKGRTARSRALAEPMMGGFLSREIGHAVADVAAESFTRGFAAMGEIPLADARWSSDSHVKYMHVCGQGLQQGRGNIDVCTAFSSIDDITVVCSPIPRGKNGLVHRRLLDNDYYNRPGPHHVTFQPQISDIKYHQPTNRVLIPSRVPDSRLCMRAFIPDWNPVEQGGPRGVDEVVHLEAEEPSSSFSSSNGARTRRIDYQINTVTPAPTANVGRFTCVIGTDKGVAAWSSHSAGGADHRMIWIAPPCSPPYPAVGSRGGARGQGPVAGADPHRDVFSLDFQTGHPDVVLFGGRPGILSVADTRQSPVSGCSWPTIRCGAGSSALAHIRSVSEHEVLVAGTRDLMAVYDLRFVRRPAAAALAGATADMSSSLDGSGQQQFNSSSRAGGRRNNGRGRTPNNNNNNNNQRATNHHHRDKNHPGNFTEPVDTPVIRFPSYRNPARLDAGLAFDAASGLVAAALTGNDHHTREHKNQKDDVVAIFSVRTGRRLRWCRDDYCYDQATSQERGMRGGSSSSSSSSNSSRRPNGPVRCLQFQRFPGDNLPSLFVGERKIVKVYSFGEGIGHSEDDEG